MGAAVDAPDDSAPTMNSSAWVVPWEDRLICSIYDPVYTSVALATLGIYPSLWVLAPRLRGMVHVVALRYMVSVTCLTGLIFAVFQLLRSSARYGFTWLCNRGEFVPLSVRVRARFYRGHGSGVPHR